MMKTLGITIFLVAFFVIAVKSDPSSQRSRKLVLFLLDGFRWDYFDKPGVNFTGFHRVFARGVKAKYMIPAFPTVSYTNYYTLMTGLHPESNGMIDNYMYDPIHNESFLLGENPEQFHSHWWNFGDPLWITAKRQGKSSYMYHWPGCEVEIRNLRPDFCIPWSHVPTNVEMRTAITESLNLFESDALDISEFEFFD